MSLRLGDSLGGFEKPTVLHPAQGLTDDYAAGAAPVSIVVGHFNSDDKADVATLSSAGVIVWLNQGDGFGSLAASSQSPLSVGAGGSWLRAAELNGDGHQDLVLGRRASNTMQFILNNGSGDGSFDVTTTFENQAGSVPSAAVVFRLDGDALDDLAITSNSTDSIGLFRNLGGGAFEGEYVPTMAVGGLPTDVVIMDFDADGDSDLAFSSSLAALTVVEANGDGTFGAGSSFGMGSASTALATGDLNGDGLADVVSAALLPAGVAVLLNAGAAAPTFSDTGYPWGGAVSPSDVAVADLDADGDLDVIAVDDGTDLVGVFLNLGDGSFAVPSAETTYLVGRGPTRLVIGDFDGEGRPDVAVANTESQTVSVLLNHTGRAGHGPGVFDSPVSYLVGFNPTSVAAADLDGDGRLELVVALGLNSMLVVLSGLGDGSFVEGAPVFVGEPPRQLAVSDLNGDGAKDLIVLTAFGSLSIAYGRGDGSFPALATHKVGSFTKAFEVGSVDGDAYPDVVLVSDSVSEAMVVSLQMPLACTP